MQKQLQAEIEDYPDIYASDPHPDETLARFLVKKYSGEVVETSLAPARKPGRVY